MTAHSASAHLACAGSLIADALIVVVGPEQLPAALRHHEKPIVIENTPANARLIHDFERLLRWQKWKDTYRLLLIVILALIVLTQMVITTKYKLDAGWHIKWDVIEMDG